jgi:hypothetical protein
MLAKDCWFACTRKHRHVGEFGVLILLAHVGFADIVLDAIEVLKDLTAPDAVTEAEAADTFVDTLACARRVCPLGLV